MLVNTEYFRESAKHFDKYGYYCPFPDGTFQAKEWWEEESRRSLEGYSVAGTRITGYHYFYLNYCPIMIADPDDPMAGKKLKAAVQRKGKRVRRFPDMWDLDYEYFHILDKAIEMGKHLVILKARRKGFSHKAGAIMCCNYFLVRESKCYAVANLEEFLNRDGLLSKTWEIMDYIDARTAFSKRRQKHNSDMHRRASLVTRTDKGVDVEQGYKSEIIGLSLKDDPDKIRGKAGQFIFFEEGGKFPGLKDAWQIAQSSMEQGNLTFGLMQAFGTGGTKDSDFESINEMYYAPDAFNALSFNNQWDEDGYGTTCGYFVPDYICLEGFIDKDGNSKRVEARAYEQKRRDHIKRTSKDPSTLDRRISEHPFTPREATLNTSINLFPQTELLAHKNRILATGKYKNLAITGDLTYTDKGLKFMPNMELTPYYNYPVRSKDDKSGCIIVYHPPFRNEDGTVPDGLYYLFNDPYDFDEAVKSDSIGSTYVMKRMNNFSYPDDIIVASWNGRPQSQDEYNYKLFQLAEYYNAQIGFESDRGDVMGYAKRFRKLHLLAPEFELSFNKDLTSSVRRKYGMHMTERRKAQGELYLRDWLLTRRTTDENGRPVLNLHYIFDPGLLEELIKYSRDPKKNFDRVSAMIIGMYMNKELDWIRDSVALNQKSNTDPNYFFNRKFYQ